MRLFHRLIYYPPFNTVIRNINYLLSPVLPEQVKIHPSGVLKVKFGQGLSILLKANQTSFLARELFWKPPGEFEYTSLFIPMVRKFSVFLDVGANIGYYSLIACKANPGLKAIAFEPSTGPLHYLRENIRLNGLEGRITVANLALSDRNGELEFHEIRNPKFPEIYNLSGEHNLGTKQELPATKTRVSAMTLDAYAQKQASLKADLIKLDTEGAEAMILRSASQLIERDRPVIICETLFNKIEHELETIMKAHGYLFFNHVANGLLQVDSILREKDNGVRNCFFVPPERVSQIQEWVVSSS